MASDPNPKPTVSVQDMDEARQVFNRFDTNGDGMISETELVEVLKALGFETSDDEMHRLMLEVDTDKDGFINLEEFVALCNGGDRGDKDLHDAFDHYDKDRDGFISSTELHLVLNRLGQSYSVDDCAKMISNADSDSDGRVNFVEFKKMMNGNKST